MNPNVLRSLTWLTFTAAIVSALLLAMGEPGFDAFRSQRALSAKNGVMTLPSEPTGAGKRMPAKRSASGDAASTAP